MCVCGGEGRGRGSARQVSVAHQREGRCWTEAGRVRVPNGNNVVAGGEVRTGSVQLNTVRNLSLFQLPAWTEEVVKRIVIVGRYRPESAVVSSGCCT